MRFLFTLSLRRATSARRITTLPLPKISIHALLAESDHPVICTGNLLQHFYPRSPCGERRNPARRPTGRRRRFLSTLSLRRATAIGRRDRAGRDISIHALLAESDIIKPLYHRGATSRFLSTLSLRRATPRYAIMIFIQYISIHALLAESDRWTKTIAAEISNFYPRSPCGERRKRKIIAAINEAFLSTLSLRRATKLQDYATTATVFLSTLSLRRATAF